MPTNPTSNRYQDYRDALDEVTVDTDISNNTEDPLYVEKIIFSFADTGTGGTALAYNQIGALPALTNGIGLQVLQDSVVDFSVSFRQNSDFIRAGSFIDNIIDDGTDTFYTIFIDFRTPIILDSRLSDKITMTISDDLSGLELFNAFGRGYQEIIE